MHFQQHVFEQTEQAAFVRSGRGIVAQALSGFAWCEVFLALGLHCFWILSKSSPFGVDNAWSALLAAIPFLLMITLGLGASNARIRSILIRLEAPFHAGTCLLWATLIGHGILQDPFNPPMPLAAPMFIWSVGLSLMLAANLAAHLRERSTAQTSLCAASAGTTLALAVLWYAGSMGMAAGAAWVVYFWTGSLVLHAALAPLSLRAAGTAVKRSGVHVTMRDSCMATVESLFLLALLLSIQLRAIDGSANMGSLETKFQLFLDLYRAPVFLAGMALCLITGRLGGIWLGHIAITAAVLLAAKGDAWPLALGLGYILPSLFRATRRQGGLGYAVSAVVMGIVWILGLAGFTFSGLIIHFNMGLEIARTIAEYDRFAVLGFLGFGLLGAVFTWRSRERNRPAHASGAGAAPGTAVCLVVFGIILAMASVPGIVLMVLTAPASSLAAHTTRQPIGEPMGVCHAGYSKSEEEYRVLDELGVQALRADFSWDAIQPAPDRWDWASKDGFVDAAVNHGKHVIALLDFDNNAVEQDPVGKARGMYIAPADIPLFLEYARQTVIHYKGRVYAWEIWNEPNIERFWAGTREEFYVLARRTAEIVRQTDPEARIIGTAMTGAFGALTSPYVDGLHAAGALACADHPSCHLYVTDPRHYYLEFAKIIASARKFNHPGSVWVTELGSPDGGFYPWGCDTEMLPQHLIKAYTIATALGIDTIVWYCFHDADPGSQSQVPIDAERFFGLIGPDEQWKPSAHAYRLFSHACSHSEMRPDLVHLSGGLAARQLRTALYRRGNGESTVILWFEPMLRPWGKARVKIDAGTLKGPVTQHDIASNYTKTLLDDHIDVTEKPVVLSFTAAETEASVHLQATSSPMDTVWLLMIGGTLIASFVACRRARVRQDS